MNPKPCLPQASLAEQERIIGVGYADMLAGMRERASAQRASAAGVDEAVLSGAGECSGAAAPINMLLPDRRSKPSPTDNLTVLSRPSSAAQSCLRSPCHTSAASPLGPAVRLPSGAFWPCMPCGSLTGERQKDSKPRTHTLHAKVAAQPNACMCLSTKIAELRSPCHRRGRRRGVPGPAGRVGRC